MKKLICENINNPTSVFITAPVYMIVNFGVSEEEFTKLDVDTKTVETEAIVYSKKVWGDKTGSAVPPEV